MRTTRPDARRESSFPPAHGLTDIAVLVWQGSDPAGHRALVVIALAGSTLVGSTLVGIALAGSILAGSTLVGSILVGITLHMATLDSTGCRL